MNIRMIFLFLAICGFVVPFVLVTARLSAANWQLGAILLDVELLVNTTLGFIMIFAMVISGLTLTAFAIYEAEARSDYYLLWIIPIVIFFSIGAALPFYLYLRLPKQVI